MIETSREKIKISKKIAQRKQIILVEGDMIIPDAKPDILKPINLSGIPTIYRKEALEGKIRIDGNINTYIMYLSDEETNETRGINTSLDFSEVLEIAKSTEGANVNLKTKLNSIECKVINERKISIKVALEIEVQMDSSEEIEIIDDIKEENNLQILKETMKVNSLIGNANTKINTKEIIQIEQTDNLAEILKANISLINKDIKISYNKVLVKADAEIKILYLTEENNVKLVVGKVPIVGFLDVQDVTENSICDVNYEMQNLIIKPNNVEEHSISVEIETEINCKAYEPKEISFVKDAYSPFENVEVNMKTVNTIASRKIIKEKHQMREKLTIESIENKKILDVEAKPVIKNENKNGSTLKYNCDMELKFILFDSQTNKVEIKEQNISFDFTSNILEEGQDIGTKAQVEIEAQDYIIQANNEVNCNIDVSFAIQLEKNSNLQVIADIQSNGERQMQKYNLIIYIVKQGDYLWKIAKKFGATIEDIVKVNNIEDENKIMVGQKIFIPRFFQNNINPVMEEKVPVMENG